MKLIYFSNEATKDSSASAVSSAGNISNTAFEKIMNEQMSKGSVVFDSALTNNNATESTTLITTNDTSIQKSPPNKINTG